jgi:hypothetical protein
VQQASSPHGSRQQGESHGASTGFGNHNNHPRGSDVSAGQGYCPKRRASHQDRAAGQACRQLAPRVAQPAARGGVARSSLNERLGPHTLPAGDRDARSRIDRLAESRAMENKGPAGPICFGQQIQQEPFPRSFTLPRDTPRYNGTTKLED